MNNSASIRNYCDYHPLSPATFCCAFCLTSNCDSCVDEGERNEPVCFTCSKPVDQLGAVNNATPFWRRLQESFRYPLKGSAALLILGVALLSSVAMYLPLGILWYLVVSGAFLKYCFSCLENTARGRLVPPDITEAYGGGLALLAKMLVMLFVAGAALFGAYRLFGPQIAALLGFLIIVALPAAIIIYGMTESLAEALNPLHLLRLISSIGLPYGLLLAFIMIMSASVAVISEIIAYEFSLVNGILQSAVSNYYSVVMFHIMGYMIFQYQGELGFTAREDDGEVRAPRSARERIAAKINIAVKEGDYNQVVTLFRSALKKIPDDHDLNRRYFEFLFATGREVPAAADRYLDYLIRSDQTHQLVIIYKRVLQLHKDYKPSAPRVRERLAMACKEAGDSRSAARLLNGLHKDSPDYPRLVEAYELLAEALDDIPHQQQSAAKCRALVEQLRKRRAQTRPPAQAPTPKAVDRIRQVAARAVDTGAASEAQAKAEQSSELPPIEFK